MNVFADHACLLGGEETHRSPRRRLDMPKLDVKPRLRRRFAELRRKAISVRHTVSQQMDRREEKSKQPGRPLRAES
jgi:hypothetical protein